MNYAGHLTPIHRQKCLYGRSYAQVRQPGVNPGVIPSNPYNPLRQLPIATKWKPPEGREGSCRARARVRARSHTSHPSSSAQAIQYSHTNGTSQSGIAQGIALYHSDRSQMLNQSCTPAHSLGRTRRGHYRAGRSLQCCHHASHAVERLSDIGAWEGGLVRAMPKPTWARRPRWAATAVANPSAAAELPRRSGHCST